MTTLTDLALPFAVTLLLIIVGGYLSTVLVAKRLRRVTATIPAPPPELEAAAEEEAEIAEQAEKRAAAADTEQTSANALPSRSFADDAKDNFGIHVSEDVSLSEMGIDLDPQIFRAYDIRGIVTENLTEDVVYWIGRAGFCGGSAGRG